MKFVLLVLSILFAYTYSFEFSFCNCGNSHAFNSKTYKCVKYPQKEKEKGFVAGCQTYKLEGENKDTFKCTNCEVTYYQKNDTCISTGLEGCVRFKEKQQQQQNKTREVKQRFLEQDTPNDSYECTGCVQNEYYLNGTQCMKNPTSGDDFQQNCIQYSFNNNKLQCGQCSEGNYLDKDNKCQQNPTNVENCKSYQYNNQNDTVDCNGCEKDFLLGKENKCVKPGDVVPQCVQAEYDRQNDKYTCNVCEKEYYTNKEKTCTEYPKKDSDANYVKDCQLYAFNEDKDKVMCGKCKSASLALNKDFSKCEKAKIDSKQKIDKCGQYVNVAEKKNICMMCEEEYAPTMGLMGVSKCAKCPKNPDSANILQIGVLSLILALVLLI